VSGFLFAHHIKKPAIAHVPQHASELIAITWESKITLAKLAIGQHWLNVMQELARFRGS